MENNKNTENLTQGVENQLITVYHAWVLEYGKDCDGAHTRGCITPFQTKSEAAKYQEMMLDGSDGLIYGLTTDYSTVIEYINDFQLEGNYEYEVQKLGLTDEQIDDIMICALEGGINYWCYKAGIKKGEVRQAEILSDCLSKGNTIILLSDDGEKAELTKEKLQHAVTVLYPAVFNEPFDYENHDADTVDNLIQLAVFGELVYC